MQKAYVNTSMQSSLAIRTHFFSCNTMFGLHELQYLT